MRNLQDQDALITETLSLVRLIAGQIARKLPPRFALDDLVAAGNVGLVKAARTFKPRSRVPFSCWARCKIRGAILDSIKDRAGIKRYQEQVAPPLTSEIPCRSRLDESLDRQTAAAILRAALARLPQFEAQILFEHFVCGRSFADLARQMGRDPARAKQIRSEALEHLRHDPDILRLGRAA